MDIVLNRESKRKTKVVIGLRDQERSFSSPAEVVMTKYPKYAFAYLTELLGVPADSAVVKSYLERFPFHTIEAHPERGTVVFRLSDEEAYTVEELLAQIISNAVATAADFAEQEISGVVITVPPYFTQAQRKAVLLVGKIANIRILQLINSNTAVGVNYGVFRQKSFNKTAQNILFYDMGATSTVATVASYATVKEKSQTTKGRTPQLEILGVGYDRTLGGNAWDLRLQEHLLSEFMKNKKVKGRDVSKNARSMAKLFTCAEKTKRVLSANKETRAQVEGLFDEIDFRAQVSRDTFENITSDLFDRVAAPITKAVAAANLTIEQIDQIILFGGGVRIPKVQEILKETMKTEALGKSINGDEAACLGASYVAAVQSKAFRVSKFLIKDANLFPIEMHFNKTKEDGSVKRLTEKIFPRGWATTKSKILLFNRSDDFSFNLKYGDLSFLSDTERIGFGDKQLSAHNLTNVSASFEKHSNDSKKGLRVRFMVDGNGIVGVEGAEYVFEREPEPEPEQTKSTLESISDYFFGSSDNSTNSTNATVDDGTPDTPSEGEPVTDSSADETLKGNNATNATTGNVTDVNASAVNGTVANATAQNSSAATAAPTAPKMIKIKVPVVHASAWQDINDPSEEFLREAQSRIQNLVDLETERQNREVAYNDLESGIYKARDELTSDEFALVSTEEQREEMNVNLTKAADWLDEDGWQANTTELTGYLKRYVTTTMKSVRSRAKEYTARPTAIKTLKERLNDTQIFILRIQNYSSSLKENETAWHTEKEISDIIQLVNETTTWLAEKEAAQNATALSDPPVLFSRHINEKIEKLYREVHYLHKKPKPKPKKPKTPKVKVNATGEPKIVIDLNSTDNSTNATVADEKADSTTEEPALDSPAADEKDAVPEKSTGSEGGDDSGSTVPDADAAKDSGETDKKDAPETDEEKDEL